MKMREKQKFKTIAEIPLEELEGQVRVEGEFIIYGSHSLCSNNIQQIINISYETYDMIYIICCIQNDCNK